MKHVENNLIQIRRNLILETVLLNRGCTRRQIVQLTKLDKNTVNQLVNYWCDAGILTEKTGDSLTAAYPGRRANVLCLSDDAPLIGGMLIKRRQLSVVIGRMDGEIIAQENLSYSSTTEEKLVADLCLMFHRLRNMFPNPIIGIGVSSLGPVNLKTQTISPPYFYNITDFPICARISEHVGFPAFLLNDVNSATLAEHFWGNGKPFSDFIYLHIMNGIGIGPFLNGELYNGDSGQSGEIGHISINSFGPLCECGNRGCLELYTNMDALNRRTAELQQCDIPTMLPPVRFPDAQCSWSELIIAAGQNDAIALCVLNEFSNYLSMTLINMIRLFDINHLIIGYECAGNNTVLESMIASRLRQIDNGKREMTILKSAFLDNAPLYGTIAIVCDRIFKGKLQLPKEDR